ncbi:TRAP transporter small permease [Shinella yambaruensis]|uniref:TRAP transporter small permease protein n=1 Tax=Shinella yambaruensis TaxID=415996 RepID=A0ABQ5ZPA2_9HYPH|nr:MULTISPECIES: TRAP transporter small permease [Shinella]MCJ8030138.1 TRAP transporter small permease [Shinella yambaruensis]MCU7984436.1 TRAP transporter small permease [Shinella yambaruensis]MCW5712698.1 TRAP transporter small permease [Shinella sp.]GLR54670.1 TRAP transporter small permease protein [Shinella yambaruensis]
MVNAYIRAVGALSRGLALIATLLIVAAMLVVCQMILLRYIFRMPTIWQTDFVVFSATAAMFLGAPYVLMKGGHVGVDVVEMIVSERTRAGMRLTASVLGLAFCIIMLAATWVQFHEAWLGNWRHSSVWAPPLWIPLSALPAGFVVLCLQYVAQILILLTTGAAPAGTHAPIAGQQAAGTGDDLPLPKEFPR